MLYALLYDGHNQLLAAAPACHVQPIGNRFWTEIYARPLPLSDDCQTAFVGIDDPDLTRELDSLENSDGSLEHCHQQVDMLIFSILSGGKQLAHREAA